MNPALAIAEAAIERGDYSQALQTLTSALETNQVSSEEKVEIEMLMATAWLGRGEDSKALEICRRIINSKHEQSRERVKQLVEILEAPSLERPDNWSIKLPNLNFSNEGRSNILRMNYEVLKKEKNKKEFFPPTGPTRNLGLGFSLFVLIVFILLTIFLSGCVRIRTEVNLKDENSIGLQWEIENLIENELTWQDDLYNELKLLNVKASKEITKGKKKIIKINANNSEDYNQTFREIARTISKSTGFSFRQPEILVHQKNFVFAVKQNIKFIFNLEELQEIPGLKIDLLVKPVFSNPQNIIASPLPFKLEGSSLYWNIKTGYLNILELTQWRLNRIGVGIFFIIFLFLISKVLQVIRLKMGFGYPELPP